MEHNFMEHSFMEHSFKKAKLNLKCNEGIKLSF